MDWSSDAEIADQVVRVEIIQPSVKQTPMKAANQQETIYSRSLKFPTAKFDKSNVTMESRPFVSQNVQQFSKINWFGFQQNEKAKPPTLNSPCVFSK